MKAESSIDPLVVSSYVPGEIGRITELHALYYSRHWGFGLFFESKVASEITEFLNRFDRGHDGFWVLTLDDKIVGSVAVDGKEAKTAGARLRWFIVDTEYQGRGFGRILLREAIGFCKQTNIHRVYLYSFAGLDAARHLYEEFGFVLKEEHEDQTWGRPVSEQTFELPLSFPAR